MNRAWRENCQYPPVMGRPVRDRALARARFGALSAPTKRPEKRRGASSFRSGYRKSRDGHAARPGSQIRGVAKPALQRATRSEASSRSCHGVCRITSWGVALPKEMVSQYISLGKHYPGRLYHTSLRCPDSLAPRGGKAPTRLCTGSLSRAPELQGVRRGIRGESQNAGGIGGPLEALGSAGLRFRCNALSKVRCTQVLMSWS